MKLSPLLLLALAACPGDDGDGGNAITLWLAPDGRETEVKLVESEPTPY
ncbi:MAG TPA: hypothetical protein VMZ53_15900 [Kofleriaceae bacterium]|nr:hypothetical protein [Kofleriaceae bacterium]